MNLNVIEFTKEQLAMTLPIPETVCTGCFLHEQRGVCPMAREAYGLQNTATEQQKANKLYAAIRQDAEVVRSLPELIHEDGMRVLQPAPSQVVLPSRGKTRVMPYDSGKEASYVAAPRSSR